MDALFGYGSRLIDNLNDHPHSLWLTIGAEEVLFPIDGTFSYPVDLPRGRADVKASRPPPLMINRKEILH